MTSMAEQVFDNVYKRAEAEGVASPRFIAAYKCIKRSSNIPYFAEILGALAIKNHFFYTKDWVEGVIEVWAGV